LTDAEIEWLENWRDEKEGDKEKQKIIDEVLLKHANKNVIKELVLVLGRRSGKTLLASIIATYESYKCLQLGNPQEYFNIAADNPIYILNIATAQVQAKLLYNEIKSRLRYSPYFADKINQKDSNQENTFFLTDQDKYTNEELKKQGRDKELIKGSVVIQCGHSNSNSLMGSGVICLIFDELAYFGEGGGAKGGDKVFNDLVPNTKAFKHPGGEAAGKVVEISAPSGKSGVFYSNFKNAFLGSEASKGSLAFQFPSWIVNSIFNYEDDFAPEYQKNEAEAKMRYGAEFSGSSSTTFFPPDYVDACIDYSMIQAEQGARAIKYYMHIDPALTNHNYAIVVLHQERFLNKMTGEWDRRVIIDHVKKWTPEKEEIQISMVERYIESLCKRFNIVSMTFDAFNSASSIQKFARKGLPAKRTAFRSSYKVLIFQELRDLIVGGNIKIPPDDLLIGEFKNLKCQILAKGFKVYPDSESAYPTDDYLDCVAGAAHMAVDVLISGLPKTTVISNSLGLGGQLKNMFETKPIVSYGQNSNSTGRN
jgi:hypothetical protein